AGKLMIWLNRTRSARLLPVESARASSAKVAVTRQRTYRHETRCTFAIDLIIRIMVGILIGRKARRSFPGRESAHRTLQRSRLVLTLPQNMARCELLSSLCCCKGC